MSGEGGGGGRLRQHLVAEEHGGKDQTVPMQLGAHLQGECTLVLYSPAWHSSRAFAMQGLQRNDTTRLGNSPLR